MKPLLFASAVLFSAALNAQDTAMAVSYSTDDTNYSVSKAASPNGEILLGELDAKSKKGQTITSHSKAAYYFENDTKEEGVILQSMLFKVQKVKYKTEARIRLYKKKDYMQEVCHKDGTKTSYASFIPGEQIATKEIVVNIEPGKKGVVEIDLAKYNIVMPAEGVFVSLEGMGYYDINGKAIEKPESKDLTWIDFHPTTTDNFCDWINPQGTDDWFWVNTNKWRKSDFEFFKKDVPKKALVAPNFGLKVARK